MSHQVVTNCVIEWLAENDNDEGSLERILWIDPKYERVSVISLSDPKSLPIWRTCSEIELAIQDGLALKRPLDSYLRTIEPDSSFLEKHRTRWEQAWNTIRDLVHAEPDIYDERRRGILVRHAVEEFHVQKSTVYKYLRKYWIGGKTKFALLPNYHRSGAPGQQRIVTNQTAKRGRPSRLSKVDENSAGVNIDDDIRRVFEVGTHRFYNSKLKAPLTHAYRRIIGEYFHIGHRLEDGVEIPILPAPSEYPTFGQYKYWFTKQFNLKRTLTSRVGDSGFELRHRSVLGDSTHMAMGPGSIYQLDATIADVYLISRFDRTKIIGRPVIYCVIDVFSRLITGFAVCLEGPSWAGASLAIANAAMDKRELCQEYGIVIEDDDWPSAHLPKSILADRGEMISKASDQLVGLGITPLNTPPYRADWKGIVEQTFRIANVSVIHWLPGAVQGRFRQRGEPDNRLDATLDLYEFTQILIKLILKHNHTQHMSWYPRDASMIQDHVKPIPLALWNWGLTHRSGALTQMPENIVRLQLLPREKATITYRGIEFKGMHYSCDRAIREQWFERARLRGSSKMTVSYDLRTADVIYLHLNEMGHMEACALLERDFRYKGHRIEDVLELHEIEKVAADEFTGVQMQSDVAFNAEVEQIVKEAAKKTKASNPEQFSKTQRVANIRENRATELQKVHEDQVRKLHGDHITTSKSSNQTMKKTQAKVEAPITHRYSERRSQDLAFLKSLSSGSDSEE